jgi:hypothetical protein
MKQSIQRMCLWPRSKFSKRKSKISGSKSWYQMKGLARKNIQVKYESPTTYQSKVISKVKVLLMDRQTDRQSDCYRAPAISGTLKKRQFIFFYSQTKTHVNHLRFYENGTEFFSLIQSSILRRIRLICMALCLLSALLQFRKFIQISNSFGMIITEET